ncbi:MAG: DEAD/DEAH box helicase family protein, partial [Pyramidobacter sp.]|nr:DEAD/DEAH box helicase family protein [Pyramidobacter sp.]
MPSPTIKSYEACNPMIYAYIRPDYPRFDGWTKIGFTERQTVEERVSQQNEHIAYQIVWQTWALYTTPPYEKFRDSAFHSFLTRVKDVERMKEPGHKDPEWFRIDGMTARQYLDDFAARKVQAAEQCDYVPRDEQAAAVEKTLAYFDAGGKEFLWNAKPRFGKTLTTYELIERMGAKNVLVVTNRPAVGNSWAEDFFTFIGHLGTYYFVSENDALRSRPGVLTRAEYLDAIKTGTRGMIAFYSLQDLKGSVWLGNQNGTDKLRWLSKNARDGKGKPVKPIEFDLIVVDESQEGADTRKADAVFDSIRHRHMLFLSGTPFKALADGRFAVEQIFNWSYADEQEAKASWNGEGSNPYEELPQMNLFTYQLSPMIRGELAKGADLSEDETVDYAFDLNEFFTTDGRGVFAHKDEIVKFLDALTTNEKYPFSTPELRGELKHTLWLLERVDSARALARMLKDHPVFRDYEVVLAAGDGKLNEDDDLDASYDRVTRAIIEHDKTITLSVGQLTVGVTIPEWSGVLMLCNLKSASAYMQAAFRAQNPCSFSAGGQWYRKERSYIFDFDPARTLIIFDEFANNLCAESGGTTEKRRTNIGRLLNFFPVVGEDDEGRLVALDAEKVMSIPARLKCVEVVRR